MIPLCKLYLQGEPISSLFYVLHSVPSSSNALQTLDIERCLQGLTEQFVSHASMTYVYISQYLIVFASTKSII